VELIKNENRRKMLSRNVAKFGKPNAAEMIVNEVFKIVEN